MAEPPQTDEGWFALHDLRTVDWDAWRDAPDHEQERAIEEGVDYLQRHEAVEDADEGVSAVFSVLGHKADLMVVHFRPTLDALSTAEREFDRTALGGFTEQTTSYVSVTEVSGYGSTDYFDDPESVDAGYRRYVEGKLHPDIPEDTYVSFYPMSKRRDPEYNWYDLDFEERADMMAAHGETGKGYAGKIKQVIASSVGFDDYEWGVTLFADDPTDLKDIVYEMRFDEVSAKYGEFGQFYVGRRFPPADLDAFLAGETVGTTATQAQVVTTATTRVASTATRPGRTPGSRTTTSAVNSPTSTSTPASPTARTCTRRSSTRRPTPTTCSRRSRGSAGTSNTTAHTSRPPSTRHRTAPVARS
jgi:chlorite dismutase